MKHKNILITGGAGFIGSCFLNLMVKKHADINFINLDLLTYASNQNEIESLNNFKNYFFYKGDICDYELVTQIFNQHNIDGVINFAAESHVDNSITNPSDFIKTNINGTFNLLKIAYDFWMKKPHILKDEFIYSKFHQISTDEVYGSILEGNFDENSSYNPSSPYSSSKACADMIVKSFNKTYGMPTLITLSSNNFGLHQNKEKFIPVILNSFKNRTAVPLYGNGKNIRDWINVKDNCLAIELVYFKGSVGESYNIGGGNELSNIELIKKLYAYFQQISNESSNVKINFIDDRFGHDFRYSVNTSKIKEKLNWSYSNSEFDDLLKSLVVSYFTKN